MHHVQNPTNIGFRDSKCFLIGEITNGSYEKTKASGKSQLGFFFFFWNVTGLLLHCACYSTTSYITQHKELTY